MNFSPVVWLPTHRATRFSASRSNSLAAGFARNERLSLSLFNDGSRSLAIRLFITVSFLLREAMVVIIRNLYVPCTEINRRNDAKQSSRECRWRNRSTRFVIIRCFLFPETQCGPQFREEKKRKKKESILFHPFSRRLFSLRFVNIVTTKTQSWPTFVESRVFPFAENIVAALNAGAATLRKAAPISPLPCRPMANIDEYGRASTNRSHCRRNDVRVITR